MSAYKNLSLTILKTVKIHASILGIFHVPPQYLPFENEKWQTLFNRLQIVLVLISLLTYTSAPLYFVLTEASEFAEYSDAAFYVAVNVLHFPVYYIFIKNQSKLADMMLDLEENIFNKNPLDREIYIEQNTKADNFAMKLWRAFYTIITCMVVPPIFVCLFEYYFIGTSSDSFVLPIVACYPWDWRTPFGFLLANCVQAINMCTGIFIISTTISIFAAFCISFSAFALDIKEKFDEINRLVKHEPDHFTIARRIDLMKQLSEIVRCHTTVKEFNNRFYDAYAMILTVFFGLSTSIVCAALLGVNIALSMGELEAALKSLPALLVAAIYVALFCLVGENMTTDLDLIDVAVKECLWPVLPMEIQKCLPIILIASRDPINMKGYFNIRCTREFFKKIMNTSISYFMVLRTFY